MKCYLVRQWSIEWLPAACIVALFTILTPASAFARTTSGKALYDQHCAFCHGIDGLADTPVGRMLKPRPRRFADPVEMARVTDDKIYHAIKDGIAGSGMASWSNVLNESQIGDIMDYIHQLTGTGKPMSTEQMSLEVGRRIYVTECAFCHGQTGQADTDAAKVLKPSPRKFSDPIEMARVDDGRMYAAIKLGIPGSAMASWAGLLSPVEIIDVMRYIRSLQEPLPNGMTPEKLDVTVGGNIYQRYCVHCHGAKGDANTALGKVLVPHPRDFTDQKAMSKLTDEQLEASISNGKPGTAMASWVGVLDPHDIARVTRYIRTKLK